ncbi:MAG: hypothetical protein O7G30_09600 [Proteobacteria bacterium]|nr:hypothetical protein [Pseudomonadota bacterium]
MSVPPLVLWTGLPPDEGEGHAAVIHRCHARLVWHRHPWPVERLRLLARVAGWPVRALVLTWNRTRTIGPAVRRRTGKPLWRQAFEQYGLALRHSIPPKAYYHLRLYESDHRSRAGEYLLRFEREALFEFLNEGRKTKRVSNKLLFWERCRERGLPTAPVWRVIRDGAVVRSDDGRDSLPRADLVLKPARGCGGREISRWDHRGGDAYRNVVSGVDLSGDALLERLYGRSRGRDWLVQPRLLNHPELVDLSTGALCTVRVGTCLDEAGRPEVYAAAFRMPVRSPVVDNFHKGGLASPVDLKTGELGPAIALKDTGDWHVAHPASGARIAGRRLPLWTDVLELVSRAHRVFRQAVVIGWDVGILADGPVLVEANVGPDVNVFQRCTGEPLGSARFGELVAFHIRRLLDGAEDLSA